VELDLIDARALPGGHEVGKVRRIREKREDELHRVGKPLLDTESLHFGSF
jgi:hypothetical protein